MAKLNMKKIELIAPLEQSKDIIDLLQRMGIVELTDYEENNSLYKVSTAQTVSQFDKFLGVVSSSKDILAEYAPVKKSLLDSFTARKELTVSEFLKRSGETDSIMAKCYEINSLARQISECKASIIRSESLMEALYPWLTLDISMRCNGTAQTAAFIGSLPMAYTNEQLLSALAVAAPAVEGVECDVVYTSRDQTCAFVMCHKSDADEIEHSLRELGFIKPADPTKHPPVQRYERYKSDIIECEKKIEDCQRKIRAFDGIQEEIDFAADYFTLRKDKYDALNKISMSQNVFALSGYVPEKMMDQMSKTLEDKFTVALSVIEQTKEDDIPTLLENNSFVAPVESITEMYSTPSKEDVDPNPVMAFFYYVFFGLMLSDAGYGVIMVIGTLIAKKKLKLERNMKKTVDMFLYCGISTVFWGAMFGSWFGDIIQTIYTNFLDKPAPRLYIWLDPVDDAMTLMLWCFLFGIIHLFAGLGIRFYQLWKDGKRLDAFFDVGFVYLLVAGAAPMAAGIIIDIPTIFTTIGKYCALIGVAGVILTSGRSSKNIFGKLGGGLYGLYNTASGYLGDVLSYSRLLALGLSTGVIAQVVNMLGTLPSNKIVKAIFLTAVFIAGHLMNMAINLIGTYVHTNRLQYVEFFSKFYEGGGRTFTPLTIKTKYFRFKEETNHG